MNALSSNVSHPFYKKIHFLLASRPFVMCVTYLLQIAFTTHFSDPFVMTTQEQMHVYCRL
jgi:hypothetical protein